MQRTRAEIEKSVADCEAALAACLGARPARTIRRALAAERARLRRFERLVELQKETHLMLAAPGYSGNSGVDLRAQLDTLEAILPNVELRLRAAQAEASAADTARTEADAALAEADAARADADAARADAV
ncbi:MAG: hypothetical protein EBU46_14585 [Nitrosomonadaceae bacterium]|nr:hypothetical protein [Nitrosomonadaceae bacterium]